MTEQTSRRAKWWTEEDENTLADQWGTTSTPRIAERLGRTIKGVKSHANRMGLGPALLGGDYITLSQLAKAVTGVENSSTSYRLKSWIENRGLPVHYRTIEKQRFRVVYMVEFWKWAEENRSFLDFSKMEPMALGREPAWVDDQRRKDFIHNSMAKRTPWTTAEDSKLILLLQQFKHSYAELSEIMCRSEGAIRLRIRYLGRKELPLPAAEKKRWTKEDLEIVERGIKCGDSYTVMCKLVGRSEEALRSKIFTVYHTRNADKVRKMMGDGHFGDGAPE